MALLGNAFVRDNIGEHVTADEQVSSVLVRLDFMDNRGIVVIGPYFGISNQLGDFVIFTDSLSKLDMNSLKLKLSYYSSAVEPVSYFTSTQGLDPENYL